MTILTILKINVIERINLIYVADILILPLIIVQRIEEVTFNEVLSNLDSRND